MRDIIRMVVVLTLIGAASGLALSAVYRVTRGPIEYQTIKFVKEPAVKKVLTGYDNDPIADRKAMVAGTDERGAPVALVVFPARRAGEVVAVALEGTGKGYHGEIGVMVGVSREGRILDIGITSHTETPGVGSKVADVSFTDQFRGLRTTGALEIDAVSGATYSSRGVVAAVEQAVGYVEQFRGELF